MSSEEKNNASSDLSPQLNIIRITPAQGYSDEKFKERLKKTEVLCTSQDYSNKETEISIVFEFGPGEENSGKAFLDSISKEMAFHNRLYKEFETQLLRLLLVYLQQLFPNNDWETKIRCKEGELSNLALYLWSNQTVKQINTSTGSGRYVTLFKMHYIHNLIEISSDDK